MAKDKLKIIKMEILYCIIALILGYMIGIKNQLIKKPKEPKETNDFTLVFKKTAYQINEDRRAYLYLLEIQNKPYLGPLWLDWLNFDYKIYSKKDAWFLTGMDNNPSILKKMDDYKNRWKE